MQQVTKANSLRILIQKFGGTSVATPDSRQLVVNKIKQAQKKGYAPVVVVSAMGRSGDPYATDTLIQVAKQANPLLDKRELDQIMCCGEMISAVVMASTLQSAGIKAVMLTGGQAGIITDDHYTQARIIKIDTSHLQELLWRGYLPVVCGFQGMTFQHQLTTLGRGGSDTTAAALGDALEAEAIEIYTDVDGIMTADPRLVPTARLLEHMSYEEACQMAYQGAKVIHPRAVELAMKKRIPLIVKSTFSNHPGTRITHKEEPSGQEIAQWLLQPI